jgi:SPP1 gp7 family putative phage head morphogenesis protein
MIRANASNDPTRTSVLRNRFANAVSNRFKRLMSLAQQFILDNEALMKTGNYFTENVFLPWLEKQQERVIYGDSGDWMTPYVTAGYMAGVRHADRTMAKVMTLISPTPLLYEEEIAVIQAQNFRLLKNINEVMNLQIKSVLTRGILEGKNPRDVGEMLLNRMSAIGRTRAMALAQTETIRAHAEASLTRFERYGLDQVNGRAEWIAAKDSRTCPKCKAVDGVVYRIQDARGLIPMHPRCRCAWLPVIPERLLNF